MNQKDLEIMQELRPLETLFNALTDEKAPIYCKQLQPFDIATIRKAVDKVAGKWDRLSFPPPGVIVAQCAAIQGAGVGIGRDVNYFDKRVAKIRKQAWDYTTTYMRDSATAIQARAEGWSDDLRRYVLTIAEVQAQLLDPLSDRRFWVTWHIIQPDGLGSKEEQDKFIYGFRKDMERQVVRGDIDVAIPMNKITEWKIRAKYSASAVEYEKAKLARKYGSSLGNALPLVAPPEDSPIFSEWMAERDPLY